MSIYIVNNIEVDIELLQSDIIDFSIEKLDADFNESAGVNDFNLKVNDGFSNFQYFIEFIINRKEFLNDEICSITTSSRYSVITKKFDLIENVKSDEVETLISQLGLLSYGQMIGAFTVKRERTKFIDVSLPVLIEADIKNIITGGIEGAINY